MLLFLAKTILEYLRMQNNERSGKIGMASKSNFIRGRKLEPAEIRKETMQLSQSAIFPISEGGECPLLQKIVFFR